MIPEDLFCELVELCNQGNPANKVSISYRPNYPDKRSKWKVSINDFRSKYANSLEEAVGELKKDIFEHRVKSCVDNTSDPKVLQKIKEILDEKVILDERTNND